MCGDGVAMHKLQRRVGRMPLLPLIGNESEERFMPIVTVDRVAPGEPESDRDAIGQPCALKGACTVLRGPLRSWGRRGPATKRTAPRSNSWESLAVAGVSPSRAPKQRDSNRFAPIYENPFLLLFVGKFQR